MEKEGHDSGVTLRIWVHPGRKQEEVRWDEWRKAWVITVREPAVEGKANRAVERLLAERLGVPSSAVAVTAGSRSPAKSVRIAGIDPSVVKRQLSLRSRK